MSKKSLSSVKKAPKPLFDTLDNLQQQSKHFQKTKDPYLLQNWLKSIFYTAKLPGYVLNDYQHALLFLYSYRGSLDTFNSYRRELERLIQWGWFIRKTSVLKLKNTNLENFIEFCLNPPKRWIATKIVARFVNIKGIRKPNPEWRPFVVKISKKSYNDGDVPDKKDFALSQQSIKALFNILNSFYNYLLQEELITSNLFHVFVKKAAIFAKNSMHQPSDDYLHYNGILL
jgi:hypothetical protein